MVSPNSRSKRQRKEGKKKQQQQKPSPAKRRRDQEEEDENEPKLKQSHVANDLAQPKTESGQISPEAYEYLRKEMGAMINELRNSLLMIFQGFHLEMKSLIEDNFRTIHSQRPNSEDECVSICTSLSSME